MQNSVPAREEVQQQAGEASNTFFKQPDSNAPKETLLDLNTMESFVDGRTWAAEDYDWDPQACQARARPVIVSGQVLNPTLVQMCTSRASGALACTGIFTDQVQPSIAGLPMPSSFLPLPTALGEAPGLTKSKPATSNNIRSQSCQADGCDRDLSALTFYHVRNKICAFHIKADVFTRDAIEMRFCQRCGRAHELKEFDGGKHSCRSQLEKHNARRRKRQASGAAGKVGCPSRAAKKSPPSNSKNDGDQLSSQNESLATGNPASESTPSSAGAEVPDKEDQSRSGPNSGIAEAPREELPDPDFSLLQFDAAELFGAPFSSRCPSPEGTAALGDTSIAGELSSWLGARLDELKSRDGVLPSPIEMDVPAPTPGLDGLNAEPPQPTVDTWDWALTLMSSSDVVDNGKDEKLANVPRFTPDAVLSTVSVKLFGCTPSELPTDLRHQFHSWFSGRVDSLEGYLRPGCVHLTVQAVVEPGQGDNSTGTQSARFDQGSKVACCSKAAAAPVNPKLDTMGLSRIVGQILASKDMVWHTKTLLVQANEEVALLHQGRLRQTWKLDPDSSDSNRVVPMVIRTRPSVLLAGDVQSTQLVVQGVNILQNECQILCRLHGRYLQAERAACAECNCAASTIGAAGDSTKGWENTCCGCCISKLATLSLDGSKKEASCCGDQPAANIGAITPQLVRIRLCSKIRPGLIHVDVVKGPIMAPRGGRVLVVSCPAVHAELLALEARNPDAADAWVAALGIIYEWVGDRSKIEYATVEKLAVRLLHEAIVAKLPAVASDLFALLQGEVMTAMVALLPLARPVSALDGLSLLSEADETCSAFTLRRVAMLAGPDSLSLLHRAVQSQDARMLELVLHWGQVANVPWRCDVRGPHGLTPLHLAVLTENPALASQMVLELLSSCEPGANAWQAAGSDDGHTPASFALKGGRVALNEAFGWPPTLNERISKRDQAEATKKRKGCSLVITPGKPDIVLDNAPATPRRCRCMGACPCALSATPCAGCISSDDEEVCCGSETGTCVCCASLSNKREGSYVPSCCH